jgi:hypothetical protein
MDKPLFPKWDFFRTAPPSSIDGRVSATALENKGLWRESPFGISHIGDDPVLRISASGRASD